MLAASGCHKDSFDFDEFTRPTAATPDDGPPRTPNIRISSTDRTAQEGSGQVVLMINSDATAPTPGGLAVMITIAGAMAGEFTANAPCTANLVCTITIPAGLRAVDLVLTPTSDAAVENSEEWTASVVDGGSNYNFAANNNVAFDITDPPTPGPMIPLPEVDIIATSDSVVEGNPVVLVITSDLAAPSTGLPVDINIGVAMDGEFTFTATGPVTCTNFPVCTVTIPSGMQMVRLTLMPLSDFSTETERWTATLVNGDDYNLDAGNNNVGFDITDLIAAIGIMTSDMPIEGGAVTLTITSGETVPATLTGGLNVTVDISGADAAEFNADAMVCTGLVCIVNIPAGSNSVSLTLSPLSDFSTETESWTASLRDGSNFNLAAGGDDNVVFAITDLIAAVGIATSDAVMEGNAVVLTITSSIAAPTNGLTVTINIGVADATEFTSGDCTGLQCVITITSGMMAELTITALSGDESENVEMWTATIEPDTAIFNVDPANDDDTFAITNLPLPARANNLMLSALDDYDSPTALAADAIRNRQSDTTDGVAITASLYADASGMPQIYVQLLEFAALGVWVSGNTPEISVDDHNFEYAFLGDNAIPFADLPTSDTATYDFEGDATYKGVNFFPDGFLIMNFGGGTYSGSLFALGSDALDDFGTNAMVPDVDDLNTNGDTADLRTVMNSDALLITFDGDIMGDGFSGTPTVTATGFFTELTTITSASFSGRFYDSATYSRTVGDPAEVAGVGVIVDGGGTDNLHFGILGRCTVDCGP